MLVTVKRLLLIYIDYLQVLFFYIWEVVDETHVWTRMETCSAYTMDLPQRNRGLGTLFLVKSLLSIKYVNM